MTEVEHVGPPTHESRLVAMAHLIASHPDCPQKPGIIQEALLDATRLEKLGLISADAKLKIFTMLLGS